MPNGFALFQDRLVLLGVGWRHDALAIRDISDAPDLEKLSRHVEIELLASDPIEFHESQLEFLMSRRLLNGLAVVVLRIALKEDVVDMLSALLRDLK